MALLLTPQSAEGVSERFQRRLAAEAIFWAGPSLVLLDPHGGRPTWAHRQLRFLQAGSVRDGTRPA